MFKKCDATNGTDLISNGILWVLSSLDFQLTIDTNNRKSLSTDIWYMFSGVFEGVNVMSQEPETES